jgi:hypothetical protein
MISESGVFEVEIEHSGVPGVLEPSMTVVRGTLSPGALNRFRWIVEKRTAASAASALEVAVRRRLEKRGGSPGVFRVTATDFS